MKSLTAGGMVVVMSQRTFSARGTHDPWPSHATGTPDSNNFVCVSGQAILVMEFLDKNAVQYFYTYGSLGDYATLEAQRQRWFTDPWPPAGKPAFGEWFNFVERPTCSGKYTFDQMIDFVNSH